ncbi:hypothetical protein ETAA8_36130 [Anatilimnocola aggregata]|uniref:Uncharacterized protein n=1 Tax=Anatilimnocola aggregata TaxID=2528021 RepID=A0A517YE68_9BACT|nr:hypothetical protein [Anatilimnocola aggregata]QDU28511.1 hypothetical protein ETAA8_36130 [Anatilimnocola aggregata]
MSNEAGGYWAKLGDRYEGTWVVQQLLLLLHERIRSVTVEAIGDDEAGVDLWIERLDGMREAQQCKVRNGVKEKWPLADLDSRQILARARFQLERDQSHEYSLVSAIPAPVLDDLANSARDSNGDPEAFFTHQIVNRSQHAVNAFQELCDKWGLYADRPHDRAVVFDLLRRMRFHLFSDDRESRARVLLLAQLAIEGKPEHVVNALANFAETNLRKRISAVDVLDELARLGMPSRRLANDPRVTVRIGELNQEFRESIEPYLAGGKLIHRSESGALLALLDEGIDAVVLHGDAGQGKSGVLFELTMLLKKRGIPFLATRLDRKRPRASARQFGLNLDLPESPTRCLHEAAAGMHCVLILDQLDALRWTSAESAEGLDVCKSIVREVMTLRSLGSRISVVLCCRSFDLEHDPQICDWLKQTSFRRIPILDLEESTVKEIVDLQKVDYSTLSIRQKQLLRTVNNLAIWIAIVASDNRSPDFRSTTDLLRAYWNNRRQCLQKSGIKASALKSGLDALVDWMENSASLSAPIRVIEHDAELTTELRSWGVIRVAAGTVSFAHQSHLDFLIADRVLTLMGTKPDAALNWLGERSQMTLYRREQLRQLLVLLQDEDPSRFIRTIEALLGSPKVRFHLKQVVMEVLGHSELDENAKSLVLKYWEDDSWKEHIESEVLAVNASCFRELFNRGLLNEWLGAEDQRDFRICCWLMTRHRDSCEDIIMSLCEPLIQRSAELAKEVFSILSNEVSKDSKLMFQLRLKCISRGSGVTYVDWKELVKRHPKRAIRLFATIVDTEFASAGDESVRTKHYGSQEDPSLCELKRAAGIAPFLAMRLLLPLYAEYVRRNFADVRRSLKEGYHFYSARRKGRKVPLSLKRTVSAALRRLAERSPSKFFEAAAVIEGLPGRCSRRLLVEAYAYLPAEFANASLNWLLADKRRLRCGNSPRRPRWLSARHLIKKMSLHCSDSVFADVEMTLMRYTDPDELRHSKFYLQYVRQGYFDNNIGQTQLHLLPALCPSRRADATVGMIGVLERKFAGKGKSLFVRQRARGGLVRSAMRKEKRLSDRAWLGLIGNQSIPNDRSRRAYRYLKNATIDTSVERFASNLRIAAEREPERFARLALRFPADAAPDYHAAILGGLICDGAPSSIPDDEKGEWRAAAAGAIDEVLCRPLDLSHEWLAKQFCCLVMQRGDLTITPKIIEDLYRCCIHPDPPENQLHINCNVPASKCSVDDLHTNALNCVRGCAALAIAAILYDHPHHLESFRLAIEKLLCDPHPAVRVAAVGICLPIWNVSRPLAIDWFRKAVQGDSRVAACREALRLYNFAFPEFADALVPVIREMVQSEIADVAENGAEQLAARWVFDALFQKEFGECVEGSVAQRRGLVHALAQVARMQRSVSQTARFLLRFAEDDDENVRRRASSILRSDDFFEMDGASEFLEAYVATRSFTEDPSPVVACFERQKGDLTNRWKSIADVILAMLRAWQVTENRAYRFDWAATHKIVPLTLRCYEQSSDEAIRNECLNLWDEMLRLRICSGAELGKILAM